MPKYPTDWSEWSYNKRRRRSERYREVSRGQHQWQYQYERTSTEEGPQEGDSRTTGGPSRESVVSDNQQSWQDGGADGVDGITENLNDINMNSQPHVQSYNTNYGNFHLNSSAGSSTSASFTAPSQGSYIDQSNVGNPSYVGAGSYPQPQYDQSQMDLPRPTEPTRWIHTRNKRSKHDELDRRFKVHRSKDFRFGAVFKVLWSEPKGATGTEITMRANGEDAHQKIRRFVVVINCPGHSLCIPILTYGGQGTTKRGVHAADHAIIYTSKKDGPQLMQNEVLYKEPIRMEPIDDSHKLDEASRVNYRKVYTVEHNVKVMFIGDLTKTARAQVIADYNLVHPLLTNSDPETDYTTDRELPGPQQTNHSSTAPSAEQGGMGTQTGPGDSTPRAETHSYTSFGNPQNVLVTSYSNPATSSFQPIVSTYQQPQSDEPPGSAEDYYSPEG